MLRCTYSLDSKVSAARLVTEQGRGPKDVAAGPGAAPQSPAAPGPPLRHPRRSIPAPDDRDALRKENDRLREENRRLLMGRDILKDAPNTSERQRRYLPIIAVEGSTARF